MVDITFERDDDAQSELSGPLRAAVEAVRCRTVPAASLERSLTRATAIADESWKAPDALAKPVAQMPAKRWRIMRAALALAALLLLAALLPSRWRVSEPSVSWAQVVAAVRERPWILYREDSEDPRRFEVWCDAARERAAFRRDKWLHFANLKTRLYDIYDVEHDTILRSPLEAEGLKRDIVGALQWLAEIVDEIPDKGGFLSPLEQITSRTDQEVVEDGHRWIDFTLDSARQNITVRVDPVTRLPASMINRDKQHAGAEQKTRFEYPANGPEDIYAFGALRTASVVDCRPPLEVAKSRLDHRAAMNKLGDYVAHIVKLSGGQAAEVTRVWRSGRSFRLEVARPTPPERRFANIVLPPRTEDERVWIEALDSRLSFQPTLLCDGTTLYQRRPDTPDAKEDFAFFMHLAPEQDAAATLFRPFISGLPHSFIWPEIDFICEIKRAEFEPAPQDGPADTMRITSHLTDVFVGSGGYRECLSKHWLDPTRENACMKYLRTEANHKRTEKATVTCCEMDGFRSGPQGVWYPTIVRNCDDDGQAIAGARSQELRIFWDFDRPIPAKTFERSVDPAGDR